MYDCHALIKVQRLKFLDECTGIPTTMTNMRTTTMFPVVIGTVVDVTCPPGHVLSGSSHITCVRGVNFMIETWPTCTIGEKVFLAQLNDSFEHGTYLLN